MQHMVITEAGALLELADKLGRADTFALDMEFQRERSYWPRLQLVQVATRDLEAAVDPLALDDLSPLWKLIGSPEIQKVVHAGRQDAEIFFNEAGRCPANVYDTQVAAALVGLGEQVGYAALVGKLLDVRIQKHERITDWGRRPLRDAQIEYALADVRHLLQVKDALDEQLEELDRASWLAEELSFYEDESTFRVDPETLYTRVSGWRSLNRRGMGILRELAAWRENEAAERDVPKARVVPDDVLLEIALRKPRRVEDLRPLRRLHPRELERSGEAMLRAVAAGLEIPDRDLPRTSKAKREDPDDALIADLFSVLLRKRARENRIAVSYVGNQKQVAALVAWLSGNREGQPPALARGWRRRMVGDELLDLYEGKIRLTVDARARKVAAERDG